MKVVPIEYFQLMVVSHEGVDFSAAEAFVRIQRLLQDKQVILVFCGCSADSSVGIALQSVDLWTTGDEHHVEVFENLNDALEVRLVPSFSRFLFSCLLVDPELIFPFPGAAL